MPQIGQDVETGVITVWMKAVGDRIKKGDLVATVEGDKAAFDIEAPDDGILVKISVDAGKEGRVLEPVGFIEKEGAQSSAGAAVETVAAMPAASTVQPPLSTQPTAGISKQTTAESKALSQPGKKVFASPVARRVARERGIALEELKGSGPGGRIMRKDVPMAALPHASVSAASPSVSAPSMAIPELKIEGKDTVIPFTRMRQIIADRLTLSKNTIPHFYLFQDIEMDEAMRWRELFNAKNGSKITITDMVVWAVASTLKEFPRINAHVEKDRLISKARICVGVATATDDGLLVPVIPDADTKDILDLSTDLRIKADEAKKGRLDLNTKGSFTVTSLGMFGTQSFLPIINPPEAAILAVGAAEPRVVAIGNLVGVRKMMTVTLACDHRAVNGAEAAQFLGRLKQTFVARFQTAT